MSESTDDRPWSELSTAEQDALMEEAGEGDDAEQVDVARIPAEQWAPTVGVQDESDAYAEGVDAAPGGETP